MLGLGINVQFIQKHAPFAAESPAMRIIQQIVTSSCRKTLPASPRHELPLSSRSRNMTFCPWVGFHYSDKTLRLDAARCTSERYRRPDPLHAIKGTQPWQTPSTTPACETHPTISGPFFCAVPDGGPGNGLRLLTLTLIQNTHKRRGDGAWVDSTDNATALRAGGKRKKGTRRPRRCPASRVGGVTSRHVSLSRYDNTSMLVSLAD